MATLLIKNGQNAEKVALFKKVRESLSLEEQKAMAVACGLEYVEPEAPLKNYKCTFTVSRTVSARSEAEAINQVGEDRDEVEADLSEVHDGVEVSTISTSIVEEQPLIQEIIDREDDDDEEDDEDEEGY